MSIDTQYHTVSDTDTFDYNLHMHAMIDVHCTIISKSRESARRRPITVSIAPQSSKEDSHLETRKLWLIFVG